MIYNGKQLGTSCFSLHFNLGKSCVWGDLPFADFDNVLRDSTLKVDFQVFHNVESFKIERTHYIKC